MSDAPMTLYTLVKDFQPLVAALVALPAAGLAYAAAFRTATNARRINDEQIAAQDRRLAQERLPRDVAYAVALVHETTFLRKAADYYLRKVDRYLSPEGYGGPDFITSLESLKIVQPGAFTGEWQNISRLPPELQHLLAESTIWIADLNDRHFWLLAYKAGQDIRPALEDFQNQLNTFLNICAKTENSAQRHMERLTARAKAKFVVERV